VHSLSDSLNCCGGVMVVFRKLCRIAAFESVLVVGVDGCSEFFGNIH